FFAAGVCLGCNVLVRFSNLPEAAMIVAVWAWDVIGAREASGDASVAGTTEGLRGTKSRVNGLQGKNVQTERRHDGQVQVNDLQDKKAQAERKHDEKVQVNDLQGNNGNGKSVLSRVVGRMTRHTLWCLGGYLAALAVLFGYIHIRYGIDAYIEGIGRLFAMTDNATDYKASSMLMGLVGAYVENLYWAVRIGAIVLACMIGMAVYERVKNRAEAGLRGAQSRARSEAKSGRRRMVWFVCCGVAAVVLAWLYLRGLHPLAGYRIYSLLRIGILFVMLLLAFVMAGLLGERRIFRLSLGQALCCVVAALMLVWLYARGFCSFEFYAYGSILRPGILFLMLTMLIGAVRILHPASSKEEKLISGMVILVVLLTSIGSNNGVYPSLNNLFVAAPYTLWQCWRFARYVKDGRAGYPRIVAVSGRSGRLGLILYAFPTKAVVTVFLAMFLFQSMVFGYCFLFAEATGARDITSVIENNEVLLGVKMSPERAKWMSEISEYVDENHLQGREVILFGQIPAMSYYLQMPSAFNPWSDLRSYSYETMASDLDKVTLNSELDIGEECPVILMDREYAGQYETYLQGGEELLREQGVGEKRIEWIVGTMDKYLLIRGFAEEYNYDLTFENEKFVLLRAEGEMAIR
ncbi:MAG: hypothetical protein NC092_12120, partial [Butyrivibrio sp.]|nr:hypothetical protein [Butyrivibrio sp.]